MWETSLRMLCITCVYAGSSSLQMVIRRQTSHRDPRSRCARKQSQPRQTSREDGKFNVIRCDTKTRFMFLICYSSK